MKLSVVTTCMNRLDHLRQTLPQNMKDSAGVSVEFVLVNYNSKDDMDRWVQINYPQEIASGLIKHVHVLNVTEYSMVHSRNVGFKAASGEVVVQVDADNYMKQGFAARCLEIAATTSGPVVMFRANHRLRGRLGFRRQEFIDLLGGYDESMKGYGADDRDIFERAKRLGFTAVKYGGDLSEFLCIKHGKSLSTENMTIKKRSTGEHLNKAIMEESLRLGRFKANVGRDWGSAEVIINFSEHGVIK
jgi:glycosyltransferase involved in cell wall biosynthesis